ncbi:hypothetical protein Ddc_11075 [Ditylenchus destructor]|nr:hypothetical protein Ddc_11075 [Ditylenchus destructor]
MVSTLICAYYSEKIRSFSDRIQFKFLLSIILLQIIVHTYRVFYGSCLQTETDYDRCNRLWAIRQLSQYLGYNPSFDSSCYPEFFDEPILSDALSDFGNISEDHQKCEFTLVCHNSEMKQGFCTAKLQDKNQYGGKYYHMQSTINGIKFNQCPDFIIDDGELDKCYQKFNDWIWATDTPLNYEIRDIWTYDRVKVIIGDVVPQLFLGPWLEMHYGSLYLASLYIAGALAGGPYIADDSETITSGPSGPVFIMHTTFLMEMSLHGQYWKKRLATPSMIFCSLTYYLVVACSVIIAVDANRNEHISGASAYRNYIYFAMIYWPLSSVLVLKGNIRRIKSMFVDCISDLWADIVLSYWSRNPFTHRVTCKCFFCRRATGKNQLWYRQKVVEEKAKQQAKIAVSRFLDTIFFSIKPNNDRQAPNRNSLNRLARNDPIVDNEYESDQTEHRLEKIDRLTHEATMEEDEAKELAEQRRNKLAELKSGQLDPSAKAQKEQEIKTIKEIRKKLVESAKLKRENANWTRQMIDH